MSLSSGRIRTSTGPAAGSVTALRSPSSSSSNDQDDPFAPPPEGAPDRPWQPRIPPRERDDEQDDTPSGPHGSRGRGDRDHGDDGRDGGRQGGTGPGPGNPWSSHQPGRQGNGLDRSGGGPGGDGQGPKFDITDPVQRRARYALLAGMWAFFFSLFGVPQIALLLGTLALYWGISSARAEPRAANGGGDSAGSRVGTGRPGASGVKPQRAAAVSGIVTGGVALAMVLGLFATQLVYRDYFDCVSDALTSKARESCSQKMPDWLRPWAGSDL